MDNFAKDLHAHPDFFIPFEARKPSDEYFECAEALLPKLWRVHQDYFWTYVRSSKEGYTVQGWKIHVSTLPKRAKHTLERVIPICVKHNTEFKFATDSKILKQLLSKNCSRSASGKFITIYPQDAATFKIILDELYTALEGEEGPYILSDRQYKDSQVIYYRYGGFKAFTNQSVTGEKTSFILSDKHAYIEDKREASFQLPEFAEKEYQEIFGHHQSSMVIREEESNQEDNAEATEQNSAEEANKNLFGGKYMIESVIKASNAGGVYIAKNAFTDEKVLIKEARPYIGIDQEDTDVIAQLTKENRILEKIGPRKIAPKSYGLFKEWEHVFLAQEFIEGLTLRQLQVKINKMTHSSTSSEEMRDWVQKINRIAINILKNIIQLHQENVIFGDISNNNVMVDEDTLATTLIDFDGSFEPGVDSPVNFSTPGFATFERFDRTTAEFSDDYFALGCVLASLVLPNTTMISIKDNYIGSLFDELEHDIGLPKKYIEVTKMLLTDKNVDLQKCADLLEEIKVDGVHAFSYDTQEKKAAIQQFCQDSIDNIFKYNTGHLNTQRAERVLPLGPKMEDSMTIDKGALGVANAWHLIKGEIPQDLKDWVNHKLMFDTGKSLPGLLNGLSGKAWALANLGYEKEAVRAIKIASMHRNLFESMSLGYGASGFGLANLHIWEKYQQEEHFNWAKRIADILCETAIEHEGTYTWESPNSALGAGVGLYEGSSGIALFLLYMYCVTNNQHYLETGEKALAFDCLFKTEKNGSVGFKRKTNDSIIYPYLAYGSAGVATVALRYYLVTKNQDYLNVVEEVKSGISHKYALLSGVATGLSGLGQYMLDVYEYLNDDSYLELAFDAASGLRLFELIREEGSTYPDANRMKVNTDYFDGSAGVALFFNRLLNGGGNPNFMSDPILDKFIKHQ